MNFLKLEDYLIYEQPTKYIVDSENYSDKFDVPVLTAGKSFILGYTNEKTNIFPKEKLPVIIFDDFTTECKYVDFPFKVKSSAMKILHPTENANPKFLYYYMKQIKFDNTLHKRYWISQYSQIEIPEFSKKIQDEFAKKISYIEKMIDIRKKKIEKCDNLIKSQFVEMFGSDNYPNYKWNDIFNTTTGKLDSNAMVDNGEYPFFTCAKESFWINEYAFDCEALMLAGNNAAGIYDVKHYKGKFNAYQRTYVLTLKNNNWKYEIFKLQLEDKLELLRHQSKGSNTRYLTMKILNDLTFKIPPIEEQSKFVKFVEKVNKQKSEYEESLKKLEELQSAIMQEYFG